MQDSPSLPPCQGQHYTEPQRLRSPPGVAICMFNNTNGAPKAMQCGSPLCLQVRGISKDIKHGGHPRRMVKKDVGNALAFLELGDQILEGERNTINLYGTHRVPPPC